MQKKAVKDNAKKSKILSAAANCFISDGFEGTSIRKIMNEAGAEVGLFYYYFKSKDDIYSAFIESLFIDYRSKDNRNDGKSRKVAVYFIY
ncbi:MAG: TetR/AcrR family transcriptional regulator [[Eubacterium] siraeum]